MRDAIYKSRPVGPEAARFGGQRINDFIFMSEGNSNAYLIETSDGSILINTGMGFEAEVHRRNFADFSTAPIKYIITTQGHVDHVGGVQHFRNLYPKAKYIAQSGNQEHQSYDARLQAFRSSRSAFAFADKFAELFAYYGEQGYTDFAPQDKPIPDITFDERYELTLGGIKIVLIAAAGAETNDSLVLWLPEQKICLTGNLFGCPFGHFPNLVTVRGDRYRDALTCARAVDTVLELEADMLLYGHHQPVVGRKVIQTELAVLRDAIHYVHDETVRGMNDGKDLHTLMQSIELPPELEVGQGYGKVSWSIRAIWESYAGWFHHQSTTELYSVPTQSIHADLIEMSGGVGVLVKRAGEKFASKEYEQALHLLDIVLSVDPSESSAVALSIQVHEALLTLTDNFWLSAWLTNQLKLLRGGHTDALKV